MDSEKLIISEKKYSEDSGHSKVDNIFRKPLYSMVKCIDCLLSMETPEGIWCLKFKGLVNESMAEKCRDFMKKNVSNSRRDDQYERTDIENMD